MISEKVRQGARIELARRDFFSYCRLSTPNFYKPERDFLVEITNEFQDFYETDDHDVLIVNVPPRHGKSLTATHFAQWVFGINPSEKIMTGSYNETLSTVFSKRVRDTIQEQKGQQDQIVYSDIFPRTKIKYGDSAMNLWSIEGEHDNYLATSPGGTATGFGASLLIVDDLIKNAEEAFNANVLEKHWQWFTNTMLSRLEENGKIIMIMTRWHSNDLAGKALKELPDLGYRIKHINMKAVQDDGTMLCDDLLSYDAYKKKAGAMAPEIASANYQQEPIDVKGKLYDKGFKTYNSLTTFKRILSYTDTANTGSDYLCTVIYGETMDNQAYMLDVVYTKEPMRVTEPLVARKFVENNVNEADIEGNNGGEGFARSVQRHMKEDFGSNKTYIDTFHQSKNKQARIISNATWLMENLYMPENWREKWPEYFEAMNTYQKEGKNKHDDAPDATTGIAEKLNAQDDWLY